MNVNELVRSIAKMTPAEQFDLAFKVAENIGYSLIPTQPTENAGAEEAIRDWWYSDRRQTMTSIEAAKSLIWYLAKCGMKIIRDEPKTPLDRQKLIDLIGYHFACVVSGNNQPDMSGDPRKRIPPIRRRHFDDACGNCADAILTLTLTPTEPQPSAATANLRMFDTSGTIFRRVGKVLTITCESDEIANRVSDQLRAEVSYAVLQPPAETSGQEG